MSDPVTITGRSAVAHDRQTGSPAGGGSQSRDAAAAARKSAPIDDFLTAIEPFFHNSSIVYVDAGAHSGAVLQVIAERGPRLRSALLVEPNPASFAALEERVGRLELADRARCFNLALSDTPGRLRFVDADTMSKVVDPDAAATWPGRTFEVDATTLDALAAELPKPHINLLKIDVEGSELSVLEGAQGLLGMQAIDMIYVEAGMDPDTTQQTYYRRIEDALATHGYKLFRIFEQVHQWREDSPLLRRVNLAFMSPDFAAAHPYRLSAALLQKSRANEALKRQLEAEAKASKLARDEIEHLRKVEAALAAETQALSRLRAEHEALRQQLEAETAERARARTEVEKMREADAEARRSRQRLQAEELARQEELVAKASADLASQKSAVAAMRAEGAALHKYAVTLEKKYLDILQSESWRVMEPARRLARLLKGRSAPTPFIPRLLGAAARTVWGGGSSKKGGTQKKPKVRPLDEKLWGGFSRQALVDIEALKAAEGTPSADRAEAAWSLARWYGAHGDFDLAYQNLRQMHAADPSSAVAMRSILLEAGCLLQRGAQDDARLLLEKALRARPGNPHLYLAMANAVAAGPGGQSLDDERLGWVNRIYSDTGLEPLKLLDPARPFAIDNLTADARPAEAEGQPKVTVIMPVYRAAATLAFALRGLAGQTWQNLEILVVDDCSPDDTVAVAEAFAATDPRVRVLPQSDNRGAYAARNAGLRAATGDFITTHDADDWSHPQKIEMQVRQFLKHPQTIANHSQWIRGTNDLIFQGLFRPWSGLMSKSVSSLMFQRAVMDRLGGWVEARVGADTEMMRRCEALFGDRALTAVGINAPLAFSLHEERSLTKQSKTHVKTIYYGVRRELHDASAHWRQSAPSEALTLDPTRNPCPFPVPASILPRQEEITCDLLFVADFAMVGGAFQSTFNYICAAIEAGQSVSVFHWRRYDLDVTKQINSALRDLAAEGRLRIVTPADTVRAKTVIFGYPVILRHVPDLLPEITLDNLVVVVNQMAARLHGGGDPQYDPAELRGILREAFGTEGVWAPISGHVRRLMRADPRYPAPAEATWVPLIETDVWCGEPLRWRGGHGARPVVGRHARDHYTKWPSTAAALRDAYCAGRPCSVEIMGGARHALKVITAQPSNWTVHSFGVMESAEFLRRLDFFVHYPHETYIEEFGRAVLEALAIGLPAVLPPVFRETFGDAAVYAEPAEVWDRIAALWADEAAYLAQARRGREFVLANSDWSQFPARLARTVVASPADP